VGQRYARARLGELVCTLPVYRGCGRLRGEREACRKQDSVLMRDSWCCLRPTATGGSIDELAESATPVASRSRSRLLHRPQLSGRDFEYDIAAGSVSRLERCKTAFAGPFNLTAGGVINSGRGARVDALSQGLMAADAGPRG